MFLLNLMQKQNDNEIKYNHENKIPNLNEKIKLENTTTTTKKERKKQKKKKAPEQWNSNLFVQT